MAQSPIVRGMFGGRGPSWPRPPVMVLTAGHRPLPRYLFNSLGKYLITEAIGLEATCPNPQMDAMLMVSDSSLTSGTLDFGNFRASISPIRSTSFCEPVRHGTHL